MKKQNRLCALYGRVSTQRQAVTEDGGLDTQFSLMEKQVDLENEKDPTRKIQIRNGLSLPGTARKAAWARTIAKNVGKTMRDQLGGPTRGPIAVKSRRHRLRVATSDRALVVTFRRDSKSSREFD